MRRILGYLAVTLALIAAGVLVSAQIDLITFTPGTPIRAEDVNTNFETLANAIQDLQDLPTVSTLNTLSGDLNLVAGDNVALTVDDTSGEITITSTAEGTAGGDITSVTAGTGLAGGGTSGGVTVSVAPAFRLPSGCTTDEIATFDGATGTWACGTVSATSYSAGSGLTLDGTEFRVQFGGSGSAGAVAHSDHDHLGQTWSGTDDPLVLEGSFSALPFAAGEQVGAPLVLTNTDPGGYGLRITEAGEAGIVVESAGDVGIRVDAAGTNGVAVGPAGNNGVYVDSAALSGFMVREATQHGLHVVAANETGVFVDEAIVGVRVDTAWSHAVDASSISAVAYGGRFVNTGPGGAALYAKGGNFDGPDLILAGNSNSDDEGRLFSDPDYTSSDLWLMSNDAVVLRLDQDDDETGNFEVRDGADNAILFLSEVGNLTIDGTLTENSDASAKMGVSPVDPRAVLEALSAVPISTWRYRDTPDALHMGPMAQDFHAAFGLGASDTGISTIDRDGVALAAIQGLHALLLDKERLIQAQQARLAEQAVQLEALEARLRLVELTLARSSY